MANGLSRRDRRRFEQARRRGARQPVMRHLLAHGAGGEAPHRHQPCMLNGQCFRFASCQFGHKTSNGPLAVLTVAILNCLSHSRNPDGSCYVDDFIFVDHNEYHGECVRADGGCAECVRHAPKAEIQQAFTYEVLDNPHMRRNEKGHSYAQHGIHRSRNRHGQALVQAYCQETGKAEGRLRRDLPVTCPSCTER